MIIHSNPIPKISAANGFIIANPNDVKHIINLIKLFNNYLSSLINRLLIITIDNNTKIIFVSLNSENNIWDEIKPSELNCQIDTKVIKLVNLNVAINPFELINKYFSPYIELRDKLIKILNNDPNIELGYYLCLHKVYNY